MLKAVSLREQTEAELRGLCAETVRHLHELRVKKSGGDTTESPMRLRTLRRELARIKTVMRERGIREHG